MNERRVIMCRTRPVLEFEYDPSQAKAVGQGQVLDERRLPLEFKRHGTVAVHAGRIDSWWSGRAIPQTRDGIAPVLQSLGLASTKDLLNQSRGLSLSDQYWVKPVDGTERWEDVNFFDNPFSEELGLTLLTSFTSSPHVSFDVPDASTGGDLPKRWTVRADGKRMLVKGGRALQEPVNEVIASELCERLGISAVLYKLGEEHNHLVSLCECMVSGDEELVSAWQVLESVKASNEMGSKEQWLVAGERFGAARQDVLEATDDWLLVDWLMRNTDRHYNNFGLIRNVETLQVWPAPIYDTGASLWVDELHVDKRDYAAKPFYMSSTKPSARRQLQLIETWGRYDLTGLLSWPDAVVERLRSAVGLTDDRARAMSQALADRVAVAIAVQNESEGSGHAA